MTNSTDADHTSYPTKHSAKGSLEPAVSENESLSLKEKQLNKDIAYTLNHALACTLVDWAVTVPAIVYSLEKIGVKNAHEIACSNPYHDHKHDHSHHDHHDHHHDAHDDHHHHDCGHDHSHDHKTPNQKHRLRMAGIIGTSEYIGDFVGIVPTVLMQRYTPWAMDGIRPVLRATLGPFFYAGATMSSNRWANSNHVSRDSDEYQQHRSDIYEHEMHHLPQAAWWTGWSSVLNVASQRTAYDLFTNPELRKEFPLQPLNQRIHAKVKGSMLSIATVLTIRAIFPTAAHRFTDFTDESIVSPLTQVVGKSIGLDRDSIDEAIEEKKTYHLH